MAESSQGERVPGARSKERKRRLVEVGAQLDEQNRATSKPNFSAPGELKTLVFDTGMNEQQHVCRMDQVRPTAQVAHVLIFALRAAIPTVHSMCAESP